jgi:signal transduction histidine kinase
MSSSTRQIMKCEEAAEFVSALCDAVSIPPEAAEHIGTCETCQARLKEYGEIGMALRRVASLESPEEVRARSWETRQGQTWLPDPSRAYRVRKRFLDITGSLIALNRRVFHAVSLPNTALRREVTRLHSEVDRRFRGRTQAATDPSEVRRVERWLATARVFLVISALAAIYMDPAQLGHSSTAYGLFVFYLANSIGIMMLLRRRNASTVSFRVLVHAADIVWPAFISVFAEGPRNPFFLFFVFVLTAAAYRWGLWETLSTAAAEVGLLWAESFVLLHVWATRGASLRWHFLAGLQINGSEFEPKRLFMLSVYLLVMGLLLGYLAEQHKHLRVYLLHRLRRRAGAAERARVGRELHDGAVQSLIAVEMQLDVLRRQTETSPVVVSGELGRIQGLLREEVLKLRELMQRMKSIEVDDRTFLSVVTDTVERFQRETGISARFVSDIEKVEMPQKICRELLRIVQEGLVNVRKHSGAHHVRVCLSSSPSHWSLTIEDDGKGFLGKAPMIIKERVGSIAGELSVESNPGLGARLEIKVPQDEEVSDEL